MQLPELIAALGTPAAYPYRVTAVDIRQTHISVVFLAGEFVYKIKKPVDFGFLDFSTLDKRRHFCQEEVRLNRRLAADVYLGVVPVARAARGLAFEGAGQPVEWAVKMRRLAEEATLEQRLARGELDAPLLVALAGKIAAFHAAAERGPRIAAFGRFDVVAQNARENFTQSKKQIGTAVSRSVFDRLLALTEKWFAGERELIERRADRGVPCDTHGDLRLEHVYVLGKSPATENRPSPVEPADFVIIDCIEFNERYRFADPVADVAFLVMGLKSHGRADLAAVLAEAYFPAAADDEGRRLLPFYTAYRAAVRAKVEGLKALEAEVADRDRRQAIAQAQGDWLLALGELEEPNGRPCLVLVGGLPGSGKSTLAAELAARAGFDVIRSDAVRKKLAAGVSVPPNAAFGEGLYSADWNERTYAECLRRAECLLLEGRRAIVDASFRDERQRQTFLEAGRRLAVPVVFVLCQADPAVIRQRLAARTGDVSDADWAIYQAAAAAWEEPGKNLQSSLVPIASGGSRQTSLTQALAALTERGLFTDRAGADAGSQPKDPIR